MSWPAFGTALTEARLSAGFAQQAELAAALGISQQTVSRWERGTSRPRAAQVPKIAAAVRTDVEVLLLTAGYAPPSTPQLSLDHPWPIDALAPETFERFCVELTTLLHGTDANVAPYGKQGHTQYGIDIDAVHTDGSRTTYQCKRYDSFGPKKVASAVSVHRISADRNIILLSSSASPQAREEIKKYSGWQLWDREDITRKARLELSKHDQLKLVDTYFVGQRMALLGEPEPSPWQTADKFFAGMTETTHGFSHAWTLQGRKNELRELIDFTANPNPPAIMLVGNGGTGKSRLLKALSDHLLTAKSSQRLFFLSRESLKAKDLEALGHKPKLLVCDDAHDREDLGLLADYVANPINKARLVLSLRAYGAQHVLQQTRSLGLTEISRIELHKLSKADSEQLAEQALKHFGAPSEYASRLSSYTQDCPLATVIGAQILANDKSLPEFLIDEDAFRNELLRRLVESTVNGASLGLDANAVRIALAAVAVLQPIKEDDRQLLEAIGKVVNLASHEVARILKRLREAGVLFQRGAVSRIAPDLLGDFLIEERCITANGTSTGFAADVFDEAPEAYAENILVNLGRLDWRKSSGVTRQSRLLDDLWSRLKWHDEYRNPHLRAAAAVAYYQPRQALDFVRRMRREGHVHRTLADIVRNAAYDFDHLSEACQLLWEMGRDDATPLNQEPSHGVRVLTELASPEPYKPVDYIEQVVEFALSLVPFDDSWQGQHNPLEILAGALATEGHTSSSSARAITMTAFVVPRADVAPIRKKIIDACIDLLSHTDTRRALAAAKTLNDAVRGPHGLFGSQVEKKAVEQWNNEFLDTLNAIDGILENKEISPVVIVRVASSTGWFAQYGDGQLKESSRRILSHLHKSLLNRTTRLLMDGWGNLTSYFEDDQPEDLGKEIERFSEELISSTNSVDDLYKYIEEILQEVVLDTESAPHILIGHLIYQSSGYAKVLLLKAIEQRGRASDRYAGSALGKLLREQDAEAISIVKAVLSNEDVELLKYVAEAYSNYRPIDSYSPTDVAVLRQIISSSESSVQRHAPYVVHQVAHTNADMAIDLAITADFGSSQQIVREYLIWLCDQRTIPFERISEAQLEAILSKLIPLPNIDDHWVQEFFKRAVQHHPGKAIAFLVSRINIAQDRSDWSYSPVPWASNVRGGLGLMQHPDAIRWLRFLFDWARSQEDAGESVLVWFGRLIRALCKPYDETFVNFLRQWTTNGGRTYLAVVIGTLRESPSHFVFTHQDFVITFLRLARSNGSDLLKRAVSALYASAAGGMRSGTPGEPFPKDIALRDQASTVLNGMTRFEPAYELYSDIYKHALYDIERQIEEGKALDEMDEQI